LHSELLRKTSLPLGRPNPKPEEIQGVVSKGCELLRAGMEVVPSLMATEGEMSNFMVLPVEIISGDETTAKAIAHRTAEGGCVIVDGRCYLEEYEETGRRQLRLRVVAEQVLFVENQANNLVASR